MAKIHKEFMYGNHLVLTPQIPWSNQASKMVDKVVVQR